MATASADVPLVGGETAAGDRAALRVYADGSLASGYNASASVTRPNNTNTYGVNDVVGPTGGGTAALTFEDIGPVGGNIIIRASQLRVDASAVISGETSYKLYLYSVTPPSALADEATFDLPSGDRASFLGVIDLGTPVDLGATLYVEATQAKPIKLTSADLFGYLVTVGTYAATANRVYSVTLHAQAA